LAEGRLYFFNKPDPNRPVDENYVAEIDGKRKSFVRKEEAMLFLFDNGIRSYKNLTKEEKDYKNFAQVPTCEFWHIENRVGYVLNDYEQYVDENDEVQKRRAFVWRFVGFGRSCFAPTKEELEEKVQSLIQQYKEDPKEQGFNTYPYYTRYYREQDGGQL
jgi:hypothetical protein